jgi:acyl-coenzyme A synthetase/AMP-(fatty) acid ligase
MARERTKILYELWRQVAATRPHQKALSEEATGQSWTFSQLAAAIESSRAVRPACPDDRIASQATPPTVFPKGTGADFILDVLRAWRSDNVVCPLEPGQLPLVLSTPLPDAIAHIKTTSATTGSPRLVAFTAEQLIADARNIVATMGLRPDWPNLGAISLAHSYGFSNLVLPLLLHGVPLVLVGGALPETVRRVAASQPELTLASVPALWRVWHEAGMIPANVRLAISAGAPLPLALEQSVFLAHGLKLHNFYGSTECGGIAYDATAVPRLDGSYAGAPLDNVRVSVAPDGCLQVQSAAVGQTYWPEPDPSLEHGRFRTSDLAQVSSGNVYLHGRVSDQINVAGRKVSPETIEEALAAHPDVRECLAFGTPSRDAERGETIVACLVVNADVKGEALKQYLMAKLPAWQVPRRWWFVPSLAIYGRGKLSRAEWRRRYLEQSPGPNIRSSQIRA